MTDTSRLTLRLTPHGRLVLASADDAPEMEARFVADQANDTESPANDDSKEAECGEAVNGVPMEC